MQNKKNISVFCLLFFLGISPLNKVFAQDDDAAEKAGKEFDDLDKQIDAEAAGSQKPADVREATKSLDQDLDQDLDKELEQQAPIKAQNPPPPTIEAPKEPETIDLEPTPEPPVAKPNPPPVEAPAPTVRTTEPPPPSNIETPAPTEVAADHPDEPDQEFEARMHRIYKNFNSTQLSSSEWFDVAGTHATETYAIQPGDTLWGVSTMLFGNGQFWPKVWSLNGSVTNPHQINPKDTIQFSSSNLGQEPQVRVAHSKFESFERPSDKVPEEQAREQLANVEMPPPLPSAPLVEIPASMPKWDEPEKTYDKDGFSISAVTPNFEQMSFVPGYISEKKPEGEGKIVEVELGGETASLFQNVIVELSAAHPKDIFTVIFIKDKIENDFMDQSAYPVEVEGQIEITESLGEHKYRAIVTNLIDAVRVGGIVQKGPMPKTKFTRESGTVGKAQTTVVGGIYDATRDNIANGLVYLEGGKDKGVNEGDILTVLKNSKTRNPDTVLKKADEPIALLKVVRTTHYFSSAIVLEARGEIKPGDETGSGDRY